MKYVDTLNPDSSLYGVQTSAEQKWTCSKVHNAISQMTPLGGPGGAEESSGGKHKLWGQTAQGQTELC